MNTIESGGYQPEQELNMDAAFASQAIKAQEIMESGSSFESKIESLANMQSNYRELIDLTEMEQSH